MFSLLVTWIVSATRLPLALMPEACETWSLEYGAYAMPCQELEVFPPEKLTPTLVVPPVTSLPVFAKIKVHDRQGDIAFNAMDTTPHWESSATPGVYASTAWIPPNLLNEGTTSIDVAVCTLHAPRLHQRAAWYDAVSFFVVDPADGDTARGRFTGQLRGVVRPLLDWTTEPLD